ncbi:MAG: dipeptide ABC transporter ATP-binding protein [Pelagibacterium sp. SCN 64-44]|nr:MAG: dipeptide ABC transporter ATP-binding protein [Pelagibacterium sp. SCN 64-44]
MDQRPQAVSGARPDPVNGNAPLLRLEDVRTELQAGASIVRAVDGVSFHINPGETLGIVGESGCGKSMTAYSIMRLLPTGGRIASGSIQFNGKNLVDLSLDDMRKVRGNDIGIVFQDPMTSLNPTMTIFNQVAEPLRLHTQMGSEEIRARVVETLELVGIPHARERLGSYPHELSGGLRQRVCIAIALVCQPKLLIADEPTTALDVTIQRQILELIDGLRKRLQMAVILVTHDLGVVAAHTDRVAVMYAGQIIETAPTAELFADPRHRYTEGLFAALPERAQGRGRALYTISGRPPDLSDPPPGCRFAPRCRHATDICRSTVPAREEASPTHSFRCFHPVGADEALVDLNPAIEALPGPVGTREPAVVFKNVVREFHLGGGGLLGGNPLKVSAVADVSFEIEAGKTFGLVGESGCGKSTISRMVAALDHPTHGEIKVAGENLFGLSRRELRHRRRNVHLMFQDPSASMDSRMRVVNVLREPLEIQRLGNRMEQDRKILELLDQVGLPQSMLDRYPHELSGGQRQRLALARALSLEPSVIVADEPVSALDVSIQAQILNLMRDLQRRKGLTYLFVSHDLSVVRYMADTIGVMYLGKLVEVGPADAVYGSPQHPYTKGLIESAPTADVSARRTFVIKGELASAINPPSGCRFRTRCPIAQDICARVEPKLEGVGGPQKVACHFPLPAIPPSSPAVVH